MIEFLQKSSRHQAGSTGAAPDDTGGEVPAESVSLMIMASRSMTWRGNLLLLLSLSVVSFSLAIALAFMGYWVVLPFAGFEVLFVGFCLYLTSRRLSLREVITIDESAVTLEWGYNKPIKTVRLPRHWSRLSYDRPGNIFDVGHINLQAHGKHYALGSRLGRAEKQELYQVLRPYF